MQFRWLVDLFDSFVHLSQRLLDSGSKGFIFSSSLVLTQELLGIHQRQGGLMAAEWQQEFSWFIAATGIAYQRTMIKVMTKSNGSHVSVSHVNWTDCGVP